MTRYSRKRSTRKMKRNSRVKRGGAWSDFFSFGTPETYATCTSKCAKKYLTTPSVSSVPVNRVNPEPSIMSQTKGYSYEPEKSSPSSNDFVGEIGEDFEHFGGGKRRRHRKKSHKRKSAKKTKKHY